MLSVSCSVAVDSGLAPTVCKNQPMSDEPGSFYCLPLTAKVETVAGVREAIPPAECSDMSDEFCDLVWLSLRQ